MKSSSYLNISVALSTKAWILRLSSSQTEFKDHVIKLENTTFYLIKF